MTAFIILTSGLWSDPAYQGASGDLTAAALGTSVPFASLIVALCSFLFGFSTLLGWSYYGEKCIEFLFGSRAIRPYRVVFTLMVFVGAVVSVPLVWAIGTLLNGFMAFPNLIGIAFLVGTVRSLTTDYFARAVDVGPHAGGGPSAGPADRRSRQPRRRRPRAPRVRAPA